MRRWIPAILLVAIGLAALYWNNESRPQFQFHGTVLQNPKPAPRFTLYTAGNRPFTLKDLNGEVALLFFGYTHCPDVCPTTMARLAEIYRALGRPKGLRVVMITIDPERDSPDSTDRYAKAFDPAFIGLSGSPKAIAKTAASYYIYVKRGDQGLFDHSATVTLIDSRQYIRLFYGQDAILDREGVIADLRYILARGGSF